MRDNGSRVLIISSWRPDPYKSGNVLVKFAMRFTHPITKNLTRNIFLQEPAKGGLPLRQAQAKGHHLEKSVFWSTILKTPN